MSIEKQVISLSEKYDSLSSIDLSLLEDIEKKYPIHISPYILEHIQTYNSKGIALQFLPNSKELEYNDGVGASFPEENHHTKILVSKYPNRCIIYTTSYCFSNCRHCSRKEKWIEKYAFSKTDFDESINMLKKYKHIEEVIITGGDPLTLSNDEIEYILDSIVKISHVKTIRIGTRTFTTNPSRINSQLCSILVKYKSLIILTQINHPDEFTSLSIKALNKIQKCGIPILNQSVLLKGLNDSYSILKELYMKCAENRVIPYYLFHCFNVRGTQCFRTNVSDGINLVNRLVGNIGGIWVPRYIVIHHDTGIKVPVAPNGLVSTSDDKISIIDYKGRKLEYF